MVDGFPIYHGRKLEKDGKIERFFKVFTSEYEPIESQRERMIGIER